MSEQADIRRRILTGNQIAAACKFSHRARMIASRVSGEQMLIHDRPLSEHRAELMAGVSGRALIINSVQPK